VNELEAFNFISEALNANSMLFVRREDFDDIASNAKSTARKLKIASVVLHIGKGCEQRTAVNRVTLA
jgi:hypothetical protein